MYHLSALLLAKAPCLNYCMASHWLAVWYGSYKWDIIGDAAGYSLAFLNPIFRFIRFRPDFWDDVPWWLTIIIGLEVVFGVIFLFLMGLAIRNLLRLR